MVQNEQVRPLAPAAAAGDRAGNSSSDEEAVVASGGGCWRTASKRRRGVIYCCGCCGVTVVILGIIILVLALTVFKVKDPVLTMNAIYLDGAGVDIGTIDHPVSVNATLTADVSIKNPNAASFRFDNSTTEFYYKGEVVGVAYAPDGRVGADRTVRMNVTVDVMTDRVAAARPNLTEESLVVLLGGSSVVNLTSYTEISGRVKVLGGLYRKDVDLALNCSMTLDLSITQQDVKNRLCQASNK